MTPLAAFALGAQIAFCLAAGVFAVAVWSGTPILSPGGDTAMGLLCALSSVAFSFVVVMP